MTTVNLRDMAHVLGVSLPTMRDLLRRHSDLPVIHRGATGSPWEFDPQAVVAFLVEKRADAERQRHVRAELVGQMRLELQRPADAGGLLPALTRLAEQFGADHGLSQAAVMDLQARLAAATERLERAVRCGSE